jgi:hypothetical protein
MGKIVLEFFRKLLALCDMLQAPKPAHAKPCEYCGGVKCIGACGLIGESTSQDVRERPAPRDDGEGA